MIKILIKIKSFKKKSADQNKGLIKKKSSFRPKSSTSFVEVSFTLNLTIKKIAQQIKHAGQNKI